MRKVNIQEALKATAPQPVAVIGSPRPDGGTNLAPVAWWTYLEYEEPNMIGFAKDINSSSTEYLQKEDKLTISLPTEAIGDKILKCGTTTGREVDKVKEFDIPLSGEGKLKYPTDSKMAFMCTITDRIRIANVIFFVCRIDEILLDETKDHLYSFGNYDKLETIPLDR